MRFEDTLLAFAQDIRDRSFWDWIKAHTSFMKPLHRYSGTLAFDGQTLVFEGTDQQEGGPLALSIPVAHIRDVHFGFDDLFRRSEDRQLGLFDFEPLRITYADGAAEQTFYLFANFHHSGLGWRSSDNPALHQRLLEALGRAGEDPGADTEA